jgi:hypothetical protein
MFVLFAGTALFSVAQAKLMPATRYASLFPVQQRSAFFFGFIPHGA